MNDKISIVLSNKNGKYVFKTITEILNDKNIIEITNTDYDSLISGNSINIKAENVEPGKDIQLVFNQKAIYNSAIKTGMSEEKALEAVKKMMNIIGSNIENIEVEEVENITSLNIQMGKNNVNTSNNTNEKYHININSIDPEKIISNIKEKVIAQDDTVEAVVRNIFNNQLIIENDDEDIINSQKTSILLDGPTGTGKTLIMKEVAKKMNLPIVVKPATMYATTGYRGVELQDMLVSLLKETNGDLEAAQRGVIVLDEFDKLGNSSNHDSSLEIRKAVQQDLLTYIGGSKFTVEYNGKSYDFDTSKLTFICLGAFTDMREKKENVLDENGNYIIEEEDYIKAGIMRELVGRFQLITSTSSLSKNDLIRILRESSISPISKLVDLGRNVYNAKIKFDNEIIEEIAQYAYEKNTGARSLNAVVNGIRNLILKDLNESRKNEELTEITITKDMLDKVKNQTVRQTGDTKDRVSQMFDEKINVGSQDIEEEYNSYKEKVA